MCSARVADSSVVRRSNPLLPTHGVSDKLSAPGAASWLCAGGRWVESNFDPPDAEEKKGLLADLENEAEITPKPPRLQVAMDCFAMVLIAEDLLSPGTLLLLSLICAAGQCTVLVFLANEYAFAEGVWLTPRSDHASLMAMRLVGLMLSMLKASGEFANALALFQALSFGDPARPRKDGGPGVRWAASMALVVQYLMSLAVVFTCAQTVLAETSPIYALLKVLSVWVVVDMDNYVAQYVVEVLDWRHLVWSVPLAEDRRHDVQPMQHNSEHHLAVPRESSLTLQLGARTACRGVAKVPVQRSKAERMVFFGVPAALVFVEVGIALLLDVLPFTYIHRGFVSNRDPPLLLGKGAGLPDGCCQPALQSRRHTHGWNFSVLLLVRRPPAGAIVEPPAPRLFWVAVAGTAVAPSSLQVIDGQNGDGLPAVQAGGGVLAKRTQAYWWLLAHHHGHSSTERIFRALIGRRGLGLYKTHLPYSANFTVSDIHPTRLDTYRIYVAAQNTVTLALSPEPIFSDPLQTSGCPPGCVQCGGHSGRCFQCSEGRHWSNVNALCAACAADCLQCEAAGDGLCDPGGCKTGFGRTEAGVCASCNVTGCSVCDRHQPVHVPTVLAVRHADTVVLRPSEGVLAQAEPRICDICERGYGLAPGRGHCRACSAHCKHCDGNATDEPAPEEETNGTGRAAANCSICELGFGLVRRPAELDRPVRMECVACGPHCRRCRGPDDCLVCAPGFAQAAPGGNCSACADGCQNCSRAGPGQCDVGGCRHGYGYNRGLCQICELAHCTVCNFTGGQDPFDDQPPQEVCSQCGEGFGRTQDGRCEDCGESCLRCDRAGACEVCVQGYTTDHDPALEGGGRCQACGDRCASCKKAGPARCDRCIEGYELEEETLTCLPATRVAVDEV